VDPRRLGEDCHNDRHGDGRVGPRRPRHEGLRPTELLSCGKRTHDDGGEQIRRAKFDNGGGTSVDWATTVAMVALRSPTSLQARLGTTYARTSSKGMWRMTGTGLGGGTTTAMLSASSVCSASSLHVYSKKVSGDATTAFPSASTRCSSLGAKRATILMHISIVGGAVDVDFDGTGGREISSNGGVVGPTARWMLMATWRRS
jgi:hypothetical protein